MQPGDIIQLCVIEWTKEGAKGLGVPLTQRIVDLQSSLKLH